MKKAFFISLSVAMIIFMASCTKNSASTSGAKLVTIDTTISSGTFSLALGAYGNRAVITRQADQYLLSEVVKLTAASSPVYRFASAAKTAGVEQVTLAVTDSSHCSRAQDSTLVTLNLKVQ